MRGSPLVEIKGLSKSFPLRGGKKLNALDNVSLTIGKGETLGIVGESGCGKSTMGRTMLKLYEPTGGKIIFDGQDVTKLSRREMLPLRRRMQMIFQDPYASLNPRLNIGDIIQEPLVIHKLGTPAERRERARHLIETVGLKPDHIRRYPHEFSGGQRQRIGIARTLALNPDFIVCDEPISALDVSIQAQIINLLEKIQRETKVSYMFIAHDLGMVHHISHRIGVMYLGSLVEYGNASDIYKRPLHPYTKALISAAPVADPTLAGSKERIVLEGETPSPLNPPPGCPFAGRCAFCRPECVRSKPETYEFEGRQVACVLYSPDKLPKYNRLLKDHELPVSQIG
jgi:oligopeptide transport system ATP-binding protein